MSISMLLAIFLKGKVLSRVKNLQVTQPTDPAPTDDN